MNKLLKLKALFVLYVVFLNNCYSWYNGNCNYIHYPDKTFIRVAFWRCDNSKKVAVICPGKGSFIEKHQKSVEFYKSLGFSVAIVEWRGQGESKRLAGPHKTYIKNYNMYVEDLHHTLKLYCSTNDQITLVGSSMGGLVILKYLQSDYGNKFFIKNAVIVAPLWGLKFNYIINYLIKVLTKIMCWLGYEKNYCLGQNNFDINKHKF